LAHFLINKEKDAKTVQGLLRHADVSNHARAVRAKCEFVDGGRAGIDAEGTRLYLPQDGDVGVGVFLERVESPSLVTSCLPTIHELAWLAHTRAFVDTDLQCHLPDQKDEG
jgi:hypothetical protein